MKRIQVLLSTYNGEKYLQQQLDSILIQESVEVSILIRDDGSTDGTLLILSKYASEFSNIEIVEGENMGYARSFMTLLSIAGDYDYYAFADQDDIWLPNKLGVAVSKLSLQSDAKPMMYYSNCQLVDETGQAIGFLREDENFIPKSKTQAVVLGFVHGCTMVFNRSSKQLLSQYQPEYNFAHDYWVPLLHFFLGATVYDENAYIQYRQHSSNTFGSERSFRSLLKHRINNYDINRHKHSSVAKELLAGYADVLSDSDQQLLNRIANYKHTDRWRLLTNKDLKRETLRGTLYLKYLILVSHF